MPILKHDDDGRRIPDLEPITAHLPRSRKIPRPAVHEHAAKDYYAEQHIHCVREKPELQRERDKKQQHRSNKPSHRFSLHNRMRHVILSVAKDLTQHVRQILRCAQNYSNYASRTAAAVARPSNIGTGVSSRISATNSSAVTFCSRASGLKIIRCVSTDGTMFFTSSGST